MKKRLSEQLDDLKNIVNRAQGIVSDEEEIPHHNIDFRLKWLLDRDFRKSTFEENPTCYASIKTANSCIPLLPLCNRDAAKDPKLVAAGLAIAKSLVGVIGVDQEHLDKVIRSLSR